MEIQSGSVFGNTNRSGQYLQFLVARVCTKLVLHCTKDARFQKAFNDKLVIYHTFHIFLLFCLPKCRENKMQNMRH